MDDAPYMQCTAQQAQEVVRGSPFSFVCCMCQGPIAAMLYMGPTQRTYCGACAQLKRMQGGSGVGKPGAGAGAGASRRVKQKLQGEQDQEQGQQPAPDAAWRVCSLIAQADKEVWGLYPT
jgi:hypothetical protein